MTRETAHRNHNRQGRTGRNRTPVVGVALLAGALLAGACTSTGTATVDTTKLNIGDGKISTTAKRGYIMSCQTAYNGGGATAKGPWFNSDGTTWNEAKKLTVDGAKSWPTANVTITKSGTSRVISGNGLPQHTTGTFPIASTDDVYPYDRNPNTVAAHTVSVTIKSSPTYGAARCVGNEVGYAINGVPIFNGFDGGGRDAVAWEAQDACKGHPERTSAYHYHSLPTCISDSGTGHSKLIGYARDGFGIYGYRGESGETMTNATLDECHGHTHTITWDGVSKSMYHYHATHEFPYTVGCYHGS